MKNLTKVICLALGLGGNIAMPTTTALAVGGSAAVVLTVSTVPAAAECTPTEQVACNQPAPITGKITSTKKFKDECVWLEFPVGAVGKPIVFFTKAEDARCIGKKWQSKCPDCEAWLRGERGPVYGPAANAVIAVRLHDGLTGVSVPRDSVERIKRDAGWCWFGKSGVYDSHYFHENPF